MFQKSRDFLLACLLILLANALRAQWPALDWVLNTGSTSSDKGNAVVIDAQGNAYAAGYHQAAADIDPGAGVVSTPGTGMYIQKFDPQGNLIWAKDFEGAGIHQIYDLALTPSGDLVAAGTFEGTTDFDPGAGTANLTAQGGKDAFILKLSPAGVYKFAKIAVSGSGVDEIPRSVGVDAYGHIVVAGWFTLDADFDPSAGMALETSAGGLDAYVAQFDSNGVFRWVYHAGNSNADAVLDMAIDLGAEITVVGKFGSTVDFDPSNGTTNLTAAGAFDGFIVHLDVNGNLVWAKPLTTGPGNNCAPNAITIDAANNIVIAGSFFGGVDLDPGPAVMNTPTTGLADMFILRLNPISDYDWSWGFGGIYQDGLYDVSADANGNYYVASIYEGTVDFDPGVGVTSATAITYKDIAVVKFSATGHFGWAALAGGANNDFIEQLRVSPQGDLYVTGSYIFTADFDPNGTQTLTAVGASDAFLYRLALCQQTSYNNYSTTACGSYTLNGITYTSSGSYTQALSTPQGCDSLINLQLTMTTLSASAQVIGNSLSASPSGANYQWIDCNNGNALIPGATAQTYTPPSAGNYAVIVTTTTCSDTSACTDFTTGVATPTSAILTLSPNPAQTQVQLRADIALGDVRVVNMLGQVLWTRADVQEHAVVVDVSGWARGVYFVQVGADARRLVVR